MSLESVLIVLLWLTVIGVALWVFNTKVKTIDGTIKLLINAVVLIVTCLWLFLGPVARWLRNVT